MFWYFSFAKVNSFCILSINLGIVLQNICDVDSSSSLSIILPRSSLVPCSCSLKRVCSFSRYLQCRDSPQMMQLTKLSSEVQNAHGTTKSKFRTNLELDIQTRGIKHAFFSSMDIGLIAEIDDQIVNLADLVISHLLLHVCRENLLKIFLIWRRSASHSFVERYLACGKIPTWRHKGL